jgi:NodT family efflux transporter outer membrane factor (OMF) lipoprotein
MRYRSILIAAPLLMAGCTVGPDYVKPDTPSSAAFKEAPPDSYREAGIWKPANPSDSALRTDWWELFGDPELSALERQVALANQDLKSAEAHFRHARALVGAARSQEYPTIGVGENAASLRDSPNAPYWPSQTSHQTGDFSLPFDLSYEVDLWGRVSRSITAAGASAQASAADLETVRLSLSAELAVDYFELRSADAQQRLLDDTVKAYDDSVQLTQDRLQGGAAPESDFAQARTQRDTARVQASDVAVRRAQYEHAIAVLTGKPPAGLSLAPSPLDASPPNIPVGLPSELLERRPDVAAAERRAAAANEQIGIALAAYYPSLSLNAESGFTSASMASLFKWPSLFWSVGQSMSETIYDGGKRDALTEAARADYDATIADYRQTTLTAFQQVEDNLVALRILEREASQQNEAVEAASTSLRLVTNRYVGGRDNYLQVITAQTAYLYNEQNAVDIERRRMDATVLLVKALGGGWNKAALPTQDEVDHAPDKDDQKND